MLPDDRSGQVYKYPSTSAVPNKRKHFRESRYTWQSLFPRASARHRAAPTGKTLMDMHPSATTSTLKDMRTRKVHTLSLALGFHSVMARIPANQAGQTCQEKHRIQDFQVEGTKTNQQVQLADSFRADPQLNHIIM